jgi:hypothetical protein
MYKKLLTISGLIMVGVAGRLSPHLPNATPITAITLAAQKHVGVVWVFVVPLAAMVLSDAVIGFYSWRILLSVYGSFALIACMSFYLRKRPGLLAPVLLAVAASILFFLVTNFAVWLYSPWYEKSIPGLLYCYALGLPFLRNMLLGDVAYTAVLMSALKIPALMRVTAEQAAT